MKKMITPAFFSFLVASQVLASDSMEEGTAMDNAIARFDAGKLEHAKTMFESLLKQNKKDAFALLYLSRISARQGEMDDAEEYIERALKLEPKNAQIQNLSGDIYGSLAQSASIFSALGLAKDSLRGYTKAVELEPDNLNYRLGLMNYHLYAPGIAGGDEDIAMEQAKAIAALDAKQGYMALAEAHLAKGEEEQLAKHLKSTPDELAKDLDVLFSKAMVYLRSKKLLNAEQELLSVIELSKEEPTDSVRLSALYQLGKLSVERKKKIEQGILALTEYLAAPEKASHLPDNNWAEFRLANLLQLQGDEEKASTMYKKIKSNTKDKRLKKEIQKVL